MDMRRVILIMMVMAALSACSPKPYVIVQVADAQLGFTAAENSQREGTEYVNDLTYEKDCLTEAVRLINEMSPDVVVFTGDQVNRSDNSEQWEAFDDVISGIDRSVKIFHLPGNHDVRIDGTLVDSSPFTERYGEDRFVHVDEGVRIVGINTNLIKSGDPLEQAQFEWLKEALGDSGSNEVKLVFGHHPFFMTDIDEEDSYFPVMRVKRRIYFDLFKDNGVTAVYAGHRHDNASSEYEGIPMRTTTSVAFQIGKSKPSIRIMTIRNGRLYDELKEIF